MGTTSTRLKAVSLSLAFWGMAASAWAQGPVVTEAEMVVNGTSHKGQGITLPMDPSFVEKAWKNYLKTQSGSPVNGESFWPFAKAKATKGIYTIEEGEIEAISSNPINIVSKVDGSKSSTLLWWALEVDGKKLSQESTPKEWSTSAGLLQQFAQNLYLEDMQADVDFAEDAVVYSKEEADRMERAASKIQAKISKSQEEITKLEAMVAAQPKEVEAENSEEDQGLTRQEIVLASKTRELNDLTKKLQKAQMRQEIAKQEMEIMSQEMEAAKAKLNKMN